MALPVNHPLSTFVRRLGRGLRSPGGWIAAAAVAAVLLGCSYTVDQSEQVVITQFGRPVGEPINSVTPGAGLHFKLPFVQTANRFERRILEWDGPPSEMTTRDKLYVVVDTFARWRIADPLKYLESLRDERSALSRLDDIIGSETRNVVARHDLIELVRTDPTRRPERDAAMAEAGGLEVVLPPIELGRQRLEQEVLKAARPKVGIWGIELLDVRVKRLNYKPGVIEKIYERMMSERMQIAERFRSEGEGEAAKIAGKKELELQRIQSEAYRKVQEIRGEADARASAVYAAAYAASPRAAEFYAFTKTLETWKSTLGRDSTLVLTTDSDLFRLLKRVGSGGGVAPRPVDPAKPGDAPP
jgi:membrane protease subunit HflC